MATTTLKTWSEGTEDDQNGLEIGGIKVTYAELSEIHDRQSAVDKGVTPDLLDMWEKQGGRHYQVEEHQREEEDQRDDDTPRTEADLADLIGRNLSGYYGLDVQTYEEAGVMTSNKGLVVRVTSRAGSATQQYQITIVRSR